jgi:hypothetical protein
MSLDSVAPDGQIAGGALQLGQIPTGGSASNTAPQKQATLIASAPPETGRRPSGLSVRAYRPRYPYHDRAQYR